jgi:hypothetical protein
VLPGSSGKLQFLILWRFFGVPDGIRTRVTAVKELQIALLWT